ncbi:MAG: hypothetical protein WD509_01710 [Candidatus Paceibacterota bacterium]
MYKNTLFISWVALLFLIAVLHISALQFSLYWVYSWFDIMMHFLGGVFVGLSALWFFFQSGHIKRTQTLQNVILVIAGAIIAVGVGWEVFEVLAGIPMEANFVADTILDLVMDGIGATTASIVFIKLYNTKEVVSGEEA